MAAAVFAVLTVGGLLSQSPGQHAVDAVVAPTASPTPLAVVTTTPAATPTIAVVTPTPAATPAPTPTVTVVTPTPAATPVPTPTVAQLAAAYRVAATAVNMANGTVSTTWDASARRLSDAKHLAAGRAAAELEFIRAVQKIRWYGDYKTLARKVLTLDNKQYVSYHSAMESKTWVAFKVNRSEAEKANMQASAASNELRIALGLPPVPDLGR